MKSKLLLLIFLITATQLAFGGGLVTNVNQSASFARMIARDASTDMDAVYYNPAGLTLLSDGLFVSVNNQSIFQTKTITNDYKYLNKNEFKGDIPAPLFPGIYAGYKMSDFVFSIGFNPVGGGGSANYDKGLPSFEVPISNLKPTLATAGVTGYSTDITFEGTSVYYGIQGGISYKINDMFSVFAGARYILANNTYKGHIRNNSVIIAAAPILATTFLNNIIIPQLKHADTVYTGIAKQFSDAGQADSAAKYTQMAAGARAKAIETGFKAKALVDQEADVTQTGNGITPIIGINISLLEKNLNIGIKYEMKTPLKLKYETSKDVTIGFDATGNPITQFPDGKEVNADIPALLTIGASYKVMPDLSVACGFHYFFEKDIKWDAKEIKNPDGTTKSTIDNGTTEIALGLEYGLTEDVFISAGFLNTTHGVSKDYQSDMSFNISSNSVAFGGKWKILPTLDINLGVLFTFYNSETKDIPANPAANYYVASTEKYEKTNMCFGIGFDYYIFGK